MKKIVKTLLIAVFILGILIISGMVYYYTVTFSYKLNTDKLINLNNTFEVYNQNGEKLDTFVKNYSVTDIKSLKSYTLNAFVAVEDKRFYKHNGIDIKGILRAMFKNVKSFSFKEGASTISQQLIKNTHLNSEKTINRKLAEIKLTRRLEKKYTKDQILEMYLNTIYFGGNLYGIENASNAYFNKKSSELSLSESATLAAIVKAPNLYSPVNNYEKSLTRRNLVLTLMCEQGFITKGELKNEITKPITLNYGEKFYSFSDLCLTELNEILQDNPYYFSNLRIYTYLDKEKQEILENRILNDKNHCDKSGIILGKDNEILAYCSTVNNISRQIGSTIKPLGVYAPAINENNINEYSLLLDEKTDFNGYKPSNFNDAYYGFVSAKTALAKSLNIPAVKILNSIGIEKSKSYLLKMDLDFSNENASLSLALGGTSTGIPLSKLTGAYGIFKNNGYFIKPKTIYQITDKNGKILYKDEKRKINVISNDTAYIVSDMLLESVENGTAKRLQNKNATIYAKTGTVGTKNGNTDAYSISFTNKYTIGVWFGNKSNAYLDSSILGGTAPTILASDLYEDIYTNKVDTKIERPKTIKSIYIDRTEYENNQKFIISDEKAPNREKILMNFSEKYLPTEISDKYSNPKIDNATIKIEDNFVNIFVTADKNIYFKIIKRYNNIEEIIFDSKYHSIVDNFIDKNINGNTEYSYSILPYYEFNNETIIGKPYQIGTIKLHNKDFSVPKDWWRKIFN